MKIFRNIFPAKEKRFASLKANFACFELLAVQQLGPSRVRYWFELFSSEVNNETKDRKRHKNGL